MAESLLFVLGHLGLLCVLIISATLLYSLEIYYSYLLLVKAPLVAQPTAEQSSALVEQRRCEECKPDQNRCTSDQCPRWFRSRILPLGSDGISILWAVMSMVNIFSDLDTNYQNGTPATTKCPPLSVDPDIAGVGVRCSFYVSGAMAATTAVLGHWHAEDTGVKGINITIFIAQLSYTFNIIKSWENPGPVAMNALIAAMMLDAHISIISMTFSMKECLAARQLVRWVSISQILALAAIAYVMLKLPEMSNPLSIIPDDGCRCFSAIWWGRFDTCSGPPTTFWLYFTSRLLTLAHDFWLRWFHMNNYDAAEKSGKDNNEPDGIHGTVYDSIPATTFTKYTEWLPAFIASIASLELTLRIHNLQNTSGWIAWGQTQQIVTASGSCVSGFYVMYSMFKKKNVMRRKSVVRKSAHCWYPEPVENEGTAHAATGLKRLLDVLQRQCRNHPFFKLPLRPPNHARIECHHTAWQRIMNCHTGYPNQGKLEREKTLIAAAKVGDIIGVEGILQEIDAQGRGIDVNAKDHDGHTALILATMNSHEGVIAVLLRQKDIDVNVVDRQDQTPLLKAIQIGNCATTRQLLDTGKVNVNSETRSGYTVLMAAVLVAGAGRGHEAILKLLLGTGKVNVNPGDQYGYMILMMAARGGHEAIVKLLLGTGKVDVDSADDTGDTALSLAKRQGDEEIVKLLQPYATPST